MAKRVAVFGGGLVGTLLAYSLAKRGHQVDVYDRRHDPRSPEYSEKGRSINLALSHRGWRALESEGLGAEIRNVALPMRGRRIHPIQGEEAFQPYGIDGQAIYSVSRAGLNKAILEVAEGHPSISFHFRKRCLGMNFDERTATIEDVDTAEKTTLDHDWFFGADGAFSAIRTSMMKTDRYNYEQFFIDHGYKEFDIPPNADGSFKLKPDALHIWPRGHFMMIALPNPDGSFTCTLFFPYEGNPSFSSLKEPRQVQKFFQNYFPELIELMPDYAEQFFSNPVGSLVTIKCFPWLRGNALLLGDAAHAIVPFYGQGMNAGFEGVRLLMELLDTVGEDAWQEAFEAFQITRKKDTDAIATLALDNFIEMRDKVGDANFLRRKRIDTLFSLYQPDSWLPAYSMVTFSHIPYSEALLRGKLQDRILDDIMADLDPLQDVEEEGFIAKLWERYIGRELVLA